MVERTLILIALAGLVALLFMAGRRFVASRRGRALSAEPFMPAAASGVGRVRLLAFSTPQCQQCRFLQKPALEEVAAQAGDVEIISMNAQAEPDLAERYGILTVPSTVILRPDGRAAAVNFGYAPARQLLEQIADARVSLAAR